MGRHFNRPQTPASTRIHDKHSHGFPTHEPPGTKHEHEARNSLDLHAIAEQLDLAVKGFPMKAMADELGKRYTTLANELSEQPGWKLGWADMLRIVRLSGRLEVLDAIESSFGRVAFALPRPIAQSGPVMALVGRLTREFGENLETLASSLEDGFLDRDEASRCLKELRDVVEACMRLQAYLEAVK